MLTPPLEPRLQLDASTFDLWFETASPGLSGHSPAPRMSAATVLRAWQDGASLVPLTDGGWAPCRCPGYNASATVWRTCLPRVPPTALCRATPYRRWPACVMPWSSRVHRSSPASQVLLEDFHGLREAPLPKGVQAILRPYQRLGVNWLAFLRQAGLGALLADDMGLGKTLQTLCVLQGRSLVVAPTSVLHHWADELHRFRPDLRVSTYHGPQRALTATADVTLTTYAILRLDADTLAQTTWDTVVLDEAQTIKNPDSQVARAAYSLRANFRLALTGTPVENRLDELWSQLHFLNRGLLGGRQAFQERYERPMAAGQPGVAAQLREKLKTLYAAAAQARGGPRTAATYRCRPALRAQRQRSASSMTRCALPHWPMWWHCSMPVAVCSPPSKPCCVCARPAAILACCLDIQRPLRPRSPLCWNAWKRPWLMGIRPRSFAMDGTSGPYRTPPARCRHGLHPPGWHDRDRASVVHHFPG